MGQRPTRTRLKQYQETSTCPEIELDHGRLLIVTLTITINTIRFSLQSVSENTLITKRNGMISHDTTKSTDNNYIFRRGWVHNDVVWKVKTNKHLHYQSKDDCHLIASYQLASYMLLASNLQPTQHCSLSFYTISWLTQVQPPGLANDN